MVYGQRVRDSLWLSDDDIKELDLKKGDGTTIRKAARQLQKVCGGGPLVPEVQQHQPGKGDETGAVLHELLDKSTPDSRRYSTDSLDAQGKDRLGPSGLPQAEE